MLIFVQFPLSDTRLFFSEDTGRLVRPTWPVPEPYKDFVRSFGMVRTRSKGGVSGWIGENEICDAHSALNFVVLREDQVAGPFRQPLAVKCASKHFFHDGQATSKFEIVLLVKPPSLSINNDQLSRLISHILHLPIRVKQPYSPPVGSKLIHAGKHLAKLYAYSSTYVEKYPYVQQSWILPGTPMTFFEVGKNEYARMKASPTTRTYYGRGFHMQRRWFQSSGNVSKIPVWILQYDKGAEKNTILLGRELRLYIMRLHAEFSCLRNLIRQVEHLDLRSDTQPGQRFQAYLNDVTRRIHRNSYKTGKMVGDEAVSDIAMSAWETVSPGQVEGFLQTLRQYRVRPQVIRKVEQLTTVYTERMTMGDNYEVNQAFNVGPARFEVENLEVHQQYDGRQQELHLPHVATELSYLRNKMIERASTSQQYVAIGEVAAAEIAARDGNVEKVKEHLKKAGKWALDTATNIGTKVAAELIVQAMNPGQ